MRKILFVVAAIALLATVVMAADLTGSWTFNVTTSAGSGAPTFVLKQDGEKLTGTYTGQFGEAPVTGTLKGDDVTISFDVQGTAAKYTGKVDPSGDKITGTCDYGGGQMTGTFAATRNKK